jgi:hypothetical protein
VRFNFTRVRRPGGFATDVVGSRLSLARSDILAGDIQHPLADIDTDHSQALQRIPTSIILIGSGPST